MKNCDFFSKRLAGYDSDYINEVYLYFIIPYIIEGEKDLVDAGLLRRFFLCLLVYALSFFVFFVTLFLSFYILVRFRVGTEKQSFCGSEIGVFRNRTCRSSLLKSGLLSDSSYIDCRIIKNNDSYLGLYQVSLYARFSALFESPVAALKDFLVVGRCVISEVPESIVAALFFFSIRAPAKNLHAYYLKHFIMEYNVKSVYFSEKECRYALSQYKLSSSLGVISYCVPHGLEICADLPGGVAGKNFYCLSEKSKNFYQAIAYDDSQSFIYDPALNKKLLSSVARGRSNKIVFFPEKGKGLENFDIVNSLLKSNIDFYIKPRDASDVDYFIGVEDKQVFLDFHEAITGNICIARKSTILLEALYSHSKPIAVLLSSRDQFYFYNFYLSLHHSDISVVHNTQDLLALINSNGEKFHEFSR